MPRNASPAGSVPLWRPAIHHARLPAWPALCVPLPALARLVEAVLCLVQCDADVLQPVELHTHGRRHRVRLRHSQGRRQRLEGLEGRGQQGAWNGQDPTATASGHTHAHGTWGCGAQHTLDSCMCRSANSRLEHMTNMRCCCTKPAGWLHSKPSRQTQGDIQSAGAIRSLATACHAPAALSPLAAAPSPSAQTAG